MGKLCLTSVAALTQLSGERKLTYIVHYSADTNVKEERPIKRKKKGREKNREKQSKLRLR